MTSWARDFLSLAQRPAGLDHIANFDQQLGFIGQRRRRSFFRLLEARRSCEGNIAKEKLVYGRW
jgi:hypothetical protein